MSTDSAKTALITSALFVAAIRLWLQVRGKTTTPFIEWAIGWGATFFILALLSEAAPTAAGSLALLLLVSDFLKNAVNITTDISGLVTGSESGSSIFTANPFSSSGTAQTSSSKGTRENTNIETFKPANF